MWILQARSIETDAEMECDLGAQAEWTLGRSSSADITIDWDPYLSRLHIRMQRTEQHIEIERLDESKNKLLFQGKPVDRCTLNNGDEVMVGSSLLRFETRSVSDEQDALFYEEVSYTSDQLRLEPVNKAERHLQILSSLPMLLANTSATDSLIEIVLNLLSEGITEADGVFVLCDQSLQDETLDEQSQLDDAADPTGPLDSDLRCAQIFRHFSRSTLPPPQISQRLWRRALRHQHGALLHLWDHSLSAETTDPTANEMTSDTRYDWAFCLPVNFAGHLSHGIYVYGHWQHGDTTQRERIDADIRFTNLLIEIATAVVQARQLDRQRVLLEQFLPKDVAKLMMQHPDSTLLDPRECELTVIYCDVEGFTARAEQGTDDLHGFLEQISSELGCASRAILDHGGVIGDFHGDAVMGFWGWPIATENAALLACQAALAIQRAIAHLQEIESEIPHSRMRIGIASGKGLAGKIGTADQMKVTAFGVAVNRANRLQAVGKQIDSYVIVDQQTLSLIEPAALKNQCVAEPLPPMSLPGIAEQVPLYQLSEA